MDYLTGLLEGWVVPGTWELSRDVSYCFYRHTLEILLIQFQTTAVK